MLCSVGMIDVNCGAYLPDGGGFLWVESSRGDAASSRVCYRELRLDTGVPECANNVCDLLTNTLSSSNCKLELHFTGSARDQVCKSPAIQLVAVKAAQG